MVPSIFINSLFFLGRGSIFSHNDTNITHDTDIKIPLSTFINSLFFEGGGGFFSHSATNINHDSFCLCLGGGSFFSDNDTNITHDTDINNTTINNYYGTGDPANQVRVSALLKHVDIEELLQYHEPSHFIQKIDLIFHIFPVFLLTVCAVQEGGLTFYFITL
jgi:hypothetical protein